MGAAPRPLMALAGFQRAMADLAASPALGAAVVADPPAALASYALTGREVRRLAAVAAQRGMTVNRMMYRSNRLTPLRSQLRHSCFMLGEWLREIVDGYWAEHPVLERNAPTEVRRFVEYLRRWLLTRDPPLHPVHGEVLAWEVECYELGVRPNLRLLEEVEARAARAPAGAPLHPHPLVGLARFGTDPAYLMQALAERRPPPYPDAPTGDFALLVDYRVQPRVLRALPPAVAEAFQALRDGGSVTPEAEGELLARGIAYRAE